MVKTKEMLTVRVLTPARLTDAVVAVFENEPCVKNYHSAAGVYAIRRTHAGVASTR